MNRYGALSCRTAARAARILLLVGVGSASGPLPVVAADAAYGEYLAAECAACHRVQGPDAAIPPFQAVSYESLVAVLKAYRDGTRVNETMQSVARSLGDAEIEALAAYLSSHS